MEIKARLNKPYTEEQRADFIVVNNHNLGYEIKETALELQAWGYTEEEEAEQREADFKQEFFEIQNVGWYRKQPKGYASAIESLNTAFNNFTVMQKMGVEEFPANVFIFYQEPDFTKPEECTEEWLIEHQFRNQAMSVSEFSQFYVSFTNACNTQMHENAAAKEE